MRHVRVELPRVAALSAATAAKETNPTVAASTRAPSSTTSSSSPTATSWRIGGSMQLCGPTRVVNPGTQSAALTYEISALAIYDRDDAPALP